MLNPNVPAWFEIPTRDLDRAQRFYEGILGQALSRQTCVGGDMAVFPCGDAPASGGGLVCMDGCEPSVLGTTVYLSVADIDPVLARVPEQGGEVLMPRTELPQDMGVFAQLRDSEGNRVGVWSPR